MLNNKSYSPCLNSDPTEQFKKLSSERLLRVNSLTSDGRRNRSKSLCLSLGYLLSKALSNHNITQQGVGVAIKANRTPGSSIEVQ